MIDSSAAEPQINNALNDSAIIHITEQERREIETWAKNFNSELENDFSTLDVKDSYGNYNKVLLKGIGKTLLDQDDRLDAREGNNIRFLMLFVELFFSGGLGFAAGLFYWFSAKEAVTKMAVAFDFQGTPLEAFLSWFMPIVGAFENSALAAYSMKSMIKEFTQPISEEEAALTGFRRIDSWHTLRTRGKKVSDLAFAAAPVIAIFAISMHGGTNLAVNIVSSLANYAPNWIGNSKFNYIPQIRTNNKLAREALANYIGQALQTFLQRDYNSCIIEKLKTLKNIMSAGDNEEQKANALFLEILKLSYIKSEDGEISGAAILPVVQETRPRAVFRKAVTGISTAAAGGYVIAAGDGAGVFLPQNPQAAAIPVALLAVLPFFGLSYISGKEVGATLFSGQKNLVDVSISSAVRRKIYNAIKYLIGILSVGSSGTNILTNYIYMRFGALPDDVNEWIAKVMAAIGGIGAPIVNGYYTLLLLDALVVAYNQRYGDENTKTLINFVLELRKLQSTILNSTPENFESYISAMCNQGTQVEENTAKAFKYKQKVNGNKVKTYYVKSQNDFSAPDAMLDFFGIKKDELVAFLKKCPDASFYLSSEIFEVLLSGKVEAPEGLEKLTIFYAKCLQDTIKLAAHIIDRFRIMDINKYATDELLLRVKKFGLNHGENDVQAFLEKKKELAEIEGNLSGACHDHEVLRWYIDLIENTKLIEPGWRVLRSYAQAHNIALNIWEAKNMEEKTLSLVTSTADNNNAVKELDILLLDDGLEFIVLEKFIPESSTALQLSDALHAIFKERMPENYKEFFESISVKVKADTSPQYLPSFNRNTEKSKSILEGCLRFRANASSFINRNNPERQPLNPEQAAHELRLKV